MSKLFPNVDTQFSDCVENIVGKEIDRYEYKNGWLVSTALGSVFINHFQTSPVFDVSAV